jgi:Uncharacterised nucleotidyltransferase
MTRWQAFNALCGYFRCEFLGGPQRKAPPRSWKLLLETAKLHCAMPQLSWCLRHETRVPADLRGYLDAVLRLNGKRNERICNALEPVIGAMNAIDVEPTLLKGVAHLIEGLYPSAATRLLSDVDILIPEERAPDVVTAMERIGFASDPDYAGTHKHLPPMRHTETNISIELHTRLVHWPDTDPILADSWVREQSRVVPFRGLRVKVPAPTIQVAHNVMHDQLAHDRYQCNQLELRQLLDLALLRARYEPEIDWAEIERRFSDVGMGGVLATYLRYDKALFGQPMPTLASTPRALAISRVRWEMHRETFWETLWEVKSYLIRKFKLLKLLASLPMLYLRERLRDPRGLVRLFNSKTWVQGFRAIRYALKQRS